MNQNFPATTNNPDVLFRFRLLLIAFGLAALCAAPLASLAAPSSPLTDNGAAAAQNVDYIGADQGAALDLDFPVLVPGWVPAPFGGGPSIDAGGGYYSLYWMIGGGDPTFLQVTGQVGGGLPAGSPYDLNVQLFINASVQGYGAIHDVTPAYDAVWWIAGGVLYKVESRNSGTDSLTLANSLIAFIPPAAQEPEPEPTSPPVETEPEPEPPVSDPGSSTGGSATVPESSTGETNQSPAEDVAASQSTSETESSSAPDTTNAQASTTSEPAQESPDVEPLGSDGTGDPSVASDGTGGPDMPVIGGDGTGGTSVVMIPPPSGPEVP